MGEGADRFSGLGSILPRPGPPSSRGPSGRGSGSGAGQPKSTRHPPPCSRPRGHWSSSATAALSSPCPGSLCGSSPSVTPAAAPGPWAEISPTRSPPGALSRVPAPALLGGPPPARLPPFRSGPSPSILPPAHQIVAGHLSLSPPLPAPSEK